MNHVLHPQKNLEDLCIRYGNLSDSRICSPHPQVRTYLNPGFFYRRNFIAGKLTDSDVPLPEEVFRESLARILEETKNGAPSLTTFTLEQAGPDAESIFRSMGFETMLLQHGMICEIGPDASYERDPHITAIRPEEVSRWTDVMLEGFIEENKQREDDVYEQLIQCRDVVFLSYRIGNELAGTSILYDTEDYPGIAEVAVPQRFRGNGIATKMIRYILSLAQEAGKPGVMLQASDMGREVYKRLGFRQVSEIYSIIA